MKTNLSKEFIGLNANIVNSTDVNMIGIDGQIVDETYRTMKFLGSDEMIRTVQKKGNMFMIGGDMIQGNDILHRPNDRLKLLR